MSRSRRVLVLCRLNDMPRQSPAGGVFHGKPVHFWFGHAIFRTRVALSLACHQKQPRAVSMTLEPPNVDAFKADLEPLGGQCHLELDAESERRLHELLHALPTAVYTTDAIGRITFYNEA